MAKTSFLRGIPAFAAVAATIASIADLGGNRQRAHHQTGVVGGAPAGPGDALGRIARQ